MYTILIFFKVWTVLSLPFLSNTFVINVNNEAASNYEKVFEVTSMAPGDVESFDFMINNQRNNPVQVFLKKVTIETANAFSEVLQVSLEGQELIFNQDLNYSMGLIDSGGSNDYQVTLAVPTTALNVIQAEVVEVEFLFYIEEICDGECVPYTADTIEPFWFYGSALLGLLFIAIIIKGEKREEI